MSSNFGLVPGSTGLQYLSNSSLGPIIGYGSPDTPRDIQNSEALINNGVANDNLQNVVQGRLLNMQTAMTLRQQEASALHANSNQAQSFVQQFIGDEIAQAKKGNDNAGKGV